MRPILIEIKGNMVRRNLHGVITWAQTRQSNGILEALNGRFQSAKRRARGFRRLSAIRAVVFLIAVNPEFQTTHPQAVQPTRNSAEAKKRRGRTAPPRIPREPLDGQNGK